MREQDMLALLHFHVQAPQNGHAPVKDEDGRIKIVSNPAVEEALQFSRFEQIGQVGEISPAVIRAVAQVMGAKSTVSPEAYKQMARNFVRTGKW